MAWFDEDPPRRPDGHQQWISAPLHNHFECSCGSRFDSHRELMSHLDPATREDDDIAVPDQIGASSAGDLACDNCGHQLRHHYKQRCYLYFADNSHCTCRGYRLDKIGFEPMGRSA